MYRLGESCREESTCRLLKISTKKIEKREAKKGERGRAAGKIIYALRSNKDTPIVVASSMPSSSKE